MRQMTVKIFVLFAIFTVSIVPMAAQDNELQGIFDYRFAPGYTPFGTVSEYSDELQGAFAYRFAPGYSPFSTPTRQLVQQPTKGNSDALQGALVYRFAPGYTPFNIYIGEGEIVSLPPD